MKKGSFILLMSFVCLYFIFGVYSFPEDTLTLEHYSLNIVLNKEKQEEAARERALLRNKTHEIMLFQVKNYYEDETEFTFAIEPKDCAGPCKEELICNEKPNKFCYDNGSITLSIPNKGKVQGFDIQRMFIDVGVSNQANLGSYSFVLKAYLDNSTYGEKTFQVNVGRESFEYSILENSPQTDGLYIGLMILSFFMSFIVFFLVFMFHGKS
ncbi:MAG: hypothetical protein ACQESG_01080 [Nanobdellota archaeon]